MENFEIDMEKGTIVVSVNPKLYPLDIVFSAAYMFTEKCYVLLDGDPQQEILVELKPKLESADLKKVAMEFGNELINYASYDVQFKRNARLREVFLQRVMLTNITAPDNAGAASQSISVQNADYLEKDAKPWSNKTETKDGEDKSREREESTETFV